MTPETLAANANLALYSSMLVYTLAMLAFSWHLAARTGATTQASQATGTLEAPEQASAPAREQALAAVAGPGASHTQLEEPAHDRSPARTGAPAGPPVPAGPDPTHSRASRQRGNVALMLTYLATLLLIGSVLLRGIAVMRPPWGNMFEFATAAAAAVGAVYCALAKRHQWQWLGLFIVAPILLVLGLSVTVLYTEAGELMPALKSYWLGIHVSIAFLAVAFFTIGFALGALSLVQQHRAGKPSTRVRFLDTLPDAPALERGAYSINMVGFILWTFTLIAGAIWAKEAWGAYWQWDPKEVWTFIIWTVYAAYMHGRATAGVNHRKTTYIAVGGYAAVIINFTLVNLMATFAGMHNYSGM
ncbi:c-type cytochrome biogenesis protein CcsB [Terrabacter terrae]|uniref:C-type cytochrome biogenesis protein CcsB n=1 Tax=Terrabacter terrae TaxID=318434 RepID=A0ABP5FIB0_9MICO